MGKKITYIKGTHIKYVGEGGGLLWESLNILEIN